MFYSEDEASNLCAWWNAYVAVEQHVKSSKHFPVIRETIVALDDATNSETGYTLATGELRILDLGEWCIHQFDAARSLLLNPKQVDALANIKMYVGKIRPLPWEITYSIVFRFVERSGAVPKNGMLLYGINISNWCYNQRQLYIKGELSQYRVLRLERIPGWFWARNRPTLGSNTIWDNDNWEKCAILLRNYVKKYGHMPELHASIHSSIHASIHDCEPCRQADTGLGCRLGMWVSGQGALYKNGLMSDVRAQKLANIDTWESTFGCIRPMPIWERSFMLLCEYVEAQHKLPNYTDVISGVKIGVWIRRQRRAQQFNRLAQSLVDRLGCVKHWYWSKPRTAKSCEQRGIGMCATTSNDCDNDNTEYNNTEYDNTDIFARMYGGDDVSPILTGFDLQSDEYIGVH